MKNMAGRKDCDQFIVKELETAGIEVIKRPQREHVDEVPYNFIGRLGKATFRRAWYYWIVSVNIPKKDAHSLNQQAGKAIRAAGFAGGIKDEELDGWMEDCESLRCVYESCITHYHVNTQEGLNLLAQTIRDILAEHNSPCEPTNLDGAVVALARAQTRIAEMEEEVAVRDVNLKCYEGEIEYERQRSWETAQRLASAQTERDEAYERDNNLIDALRDVARDCTSAEVAQAIMLVFRRSGVV